MMNYPLRLLLYVWCAVLLQGLGLFAKKDFEMVSCVRTVLLLFCGVLKGKVMEGIYEVLFVL